MLFGNKHNQAQAPPLTKNLSHKWWLNDESQLVKGVLGHSFLDTLPARLIGDKAYDCDRLDCELAEHYGIEMIAPQRKPSQDGRPLRRHRRRWRVERLFAWLHNFRRLVIRWEYHVVNFLAWSAWVARKSYLGIYDRYS